jgi:hypothetical protein
LQCSCEFSFINHTIEFSAYSSQSLLLVSFESSSQRLPESQWHRDQPDRRSTMSCSHRLSEVRGISRQSMALAASAVTRASGPFADVSASASFNSGLARKGWRFYLTMQPDERLILGYHPDTRYVIYDIKSNSVCSSWRKRQLTRSATNA